MLTTDMISPAIARPLGLEKTPMRENRNPRIMANHPAKGIKPKNKPNMEITIPLVPRLFLRGLTMTVTGGWLL